MNSRVWKRALTPQEILSNSCNVPANSTGLEANWKMDEGSGMGALDATANTQFSNPDQYDRCELENRRCLYFISCGKRS